MGIHGEAIHAGNILGNALVAIDRTHLISQLGIPCGGGDHGAVVHSQGLTVHQVMEALGTVHIDTGFLLDGGNGRILPAAGAGQRDHLIHGHPIKQLIPGRIIIVLTHQVLTINIHTLVTGDRHRHIAVLRDGSTHLRIGHDGHDSGIRLGGLISVGFREGANEVSTGQIICSIIGAITGSHIVKQVDGSFLIGGPGIGSIINLAVQGNSVGQNVGGGPAMGTVIAQIGVENIIAGIQYIALGSLVIIGCQRILIDRDGYGFAGVGRQF